MTPLTQLIFCLTLFTASRTKCQAAGMADLPAMHEAEISSLVRRQGCAVPQFGFCAGLGGRCCPAAGPECCVVNCSPLEWTIDAVEGRGQCCSSGLFCPGGSWCIWDKTAGQQKCCPHANVGYPIPCGITDGIWNAVYQNPPVPATPVDYPIPTITATNAAVPT